jgi:putative membrane protein
VIPPVSRDWAPYCGAAPVPEEIFARWNLDPLLLLALAGATVVLWGASRRPVPSAGVLAIALLLFVSPFCALSSALFSARVAHHVLLTAVVAPLMIYALPPEKLRWPGSLSMWTGLQAFTFWAWHAPTAYAAALSSHLVYWAMQLTLLGTAMGFWAAVRRASAPSAVAALLFSTVQMGLLGALITFAGAPLYSPHYFSTMPWGYSPLEDQQLAGLIMWAPAAALYLAAALLVAGRWLAREDREAVA